MVFTTRSLALFAATAALLVPAQAQTYTNCNPLKKSCPPDQALGGTYEIDLTSTKADDFIVSGDISYDGNGLQLAVSKENRGPYMQSKFYMMFGRVDVTMKAAPGAGVVSSFILQSDDLDEIDLEWVGDDATLFQTNFFGKGFTGTYNRGQNFHAADAAADFHTYSIDWNAERIQWIADGKVLRTLVPSDFPGQYPQSPMFIKFGPWAAGDPTHNAKGTVQWADGPIDWNAGPYPMYVTSITAADYSTGTAYKYTDQTGSWQSIEAVGGQVNSDATDSSGGNVDPGSSSSSSSSSSSKTHSTSSTKTSSHSTKETSSTTKTGSGSGSSSTPTGGSSSGNSSSSAHPGSGSGSGSSSTSGGSPSPTGSSGNNSPSDGNAPDDSPDNGVSSGKQAALGLSMACALVGLVAAL